MSFLPKILILLIKTQQVLLFGEGRSEQGERERQGRGRRKGKRRDKWGKGDTKLALFQSI